MRSFAPRPSRLLLIGAVVVLVSAAFNAPSSAAGTTSAHDDVPAPAAVPANDAARGFVDDGLRSGTGRCRGLLEITTIPGACTHGPDTPPAGLDVKRSVPPLSPLTAAPLSVVCDGDGQSGNRVQVLYVHGSGNADRYSQYLARSEERRVGKEGRSRWSRA